MGISLRPDDNVIAGFMNCSEDYVTITGNALTFTSEGKLEMMPNYNYDYISFILHPSKSLQKTFPISACSSSYL